MSLLCSSANQLTQTLLSFSVCVLYTYQLHFSLCVGVIYLLSPLSPFVFFTSLLLPFVSMCCSFRRFPPSLFVCLPLHYLSSFPILSVLFLRLLFVTPLSFSLFSSLFLSLSPLRLLSLSLASISFLGDRSLSASMLNYCLSVTALL